MTEQRKRQSLTGEVVSTKMDKTAVVKVTRKIKTSVFIKNI